MVMMMIIIIIIIIEYIYGGPNINAVGK